MKQHRLYMMPQTGNIDTLEAWLDAATEDAARHQLGREEIDSGIAALIPVRYSKETQQWEEE
jgi:hypothetical protein